MGLVETEALILKSYNLSDADKIVVLLTREEGLVRGVARGAKRLKSRFGGTLEPFSVVNLAFFRKEDRELVSIRQIELERSFFKDASELGFLQKFGYLSELLISFAPPHDPNERLYKMTRVCLEAASENKGVEGSLESIALYFELWLLRLGGFLPPWAECSRCRRTLEDEEEVSLEADFRVVCGLCRKVSEGRRLTPNQRKAGALAQKVPPHRFVKVTSQHASDVAVLSSIMKRIIAQIIGREPNASQTVRSGAANP